MLSLVDFKQIFKRCNMKTSILIFLLVIGSEKTFGVREVILPPIQFTNDVGGLMLNSAGNKVACHATNSQAISSDNINNVLDGVCGTWETTIVTLNNISASAQTVTLTVMKGSRVQSFHSNGAVSVLALTAGKSLNVSTSVSTAKFLVAAYSPLQITFWTLCNMTACGLGWINTTNGVSTIGFNLMAGTLTPSAATSCSIANQNVCFTNYGLLTIKISIDENSGAMNGNVSQIAGNHGGRFRFPGPRPNFLILGGRAF